MTSIKVQSIVHDIVQESSRKFNDNAYTCLKIKMVNNEVKIPNGCGQFDYYISPLKDFVILLFNPGTFKNENYDDVCSRMACEFCKMNGGENVYVQIIELVGKVKVTSFLHTIIFQEILRVCNSPADCQIVEDAIENAREKWDKLKPDEKYGAFTSFVASLDFNEVKRNLFKEK